MKSLTKYNREIIYIGLFIVISIIVKPNINELVADIMANVLLLCLCLWYLNKKLVLKLNSLLILQIMHGLWSAMLILLLVLIIYSMCFNIHAIFAFRIIPFFEYASYFLFQGLIAITEELIFRKCFYRIFQNMHMHKTITIILISVFFGLWHFYFHNSYMQVVSSVVFSLLLFIFQLRIRYYTLVSCISTHFIYNLLCYYLLFY